VDIRILLVDDHAPFRQCLAALLSRKPGLRVVAEAGDGEAALDLLAACAEADRPQVMVVDVQMPGLDGIETARRAHALYPALAIVALTLHDDPQLATAMTAAGARRYLRKGDRMADIVRAIRQVAASAP
jgi:DNA-binding NarL/FixJ family response regulator